MFASVVTVDPAVVVTSPVNAGIAAAVISPAWIADITTFVPLPRRYCPEAVDAAMALSAFCCVLAPVPPRLTGSVPVAMFDALIEVLVTEVILPFASTAICGTCDSVPNVPTLGFTLGSSVAIVAFLVIAGLVPWFTTIKSASDSVVAVGKLEIFTSAITSRCIACSSAALVLLGAAPCQ